MDAALAAEVARAEARIATQRREKAEARRAQAEAKVAALREQGSSEPDPEQALRVVRAALGAEPGRSTVNRE